VSTTNVAVTQTESGSALPMTAVMLPCENLQIGGPGQLDGGLSTSCCSLDRAHRRRCGKNEKTRIEPRHVFANRRLSSGDAWVSLTTLRKYLSSQRTCLTVDLFLFSLRDCLNENERYLLLPERAGMTGREILGSSALERRPVPRFDLLRT